MTGVKHQVLELMALVDKQVIDPHHFEVYHVVLALGNGVPDVLQFGCERQFTLF